MNAREQLTGSTYGSTTPLTATYGFDTYGYPNSTATGSVQDYRYVFDPLTGNLTSRQNFLQSKSESFTYDTTLDRLLTVTGPQNLTMTYNANGNISTKSDIGTTAFSYGTSAGPYALTGLTSTTAVIPSTNQTATYTSFEKVSTLTEGVYTAAFIYNADQQRAKMDVTQSGTNILTRFYAGSSDMREIIGGVTKEYAYIGGDAYSAPVVAVNTYGTIVYYYLLRDYLGNITHVYNASTSTAQEYSFDAWGRRRNPTDWSYNITTQPALFADRGFTSHEFLSQFNLYNMNGRMYDPLVGRFLSADNYVQDPTATQNYNRYSYCLNNPLKYNDPSGWLTDAEMDEVETTWNDMVSNPESTSTGMYSWGSGGFSYSSSERDAYTFLANYNNQNNSWGNPEFKNGAHVEVHYTNMDECPNNPQVPYDYYFVANKADNFNNYTPFVFSNPTGGRINDLAEDYGMSFKGDGGIKAEFYTKTGLGGSYNYKVFGYQLGLGVDIISKKRSIVYNGTKITQSNSNISSLSVSLLIASYSIEYNYTKQEFTDEFIIGTMVFGSNGYSTRLAGGDFGIIGQFGGKFDVNPIYAFAMLSSFIVNVKYDLLYASFVATNPVASAYTIEFEVGYNTVPGTISGRVTNVNNAGP